MFPPKPLDGTSTVTWYDTPDTSFSIKVFHSPLVFDDAELGYCLDT